MIGFSSPFDPLLELLDDFLLLGESTGLGSISGFSLIEELDEDFLLFGESTFGLISSSCFGDSGLGMFSLLELDSESLSAGGSPG